MCTTAEWVDTLIYLWVGEGTIWHLKRSLDTIYDYMSINHIVVNHYMTCAFGSVLLFLKCLMDW